MQFISPGLAQYRLSYELAPIILTGGVAQAIPGGMLPMVSITQAADFTTGLLSPGEGLTLDDFFANFQPLPGATLIDNEVSLYPFANMAVAANAIIAKPLYISMIMFCPAKGAGGYALKQATLTALQSTFSAHNTQGGTYTVATPSYTWTNCIMLKMQDVSTALSKQVQTAWRIDFFQPLVTLAAAAAAQNAMMSKLTSGVQNDGSLSGLSPVLGTAPTVTTPGVAPAAQSTAGSGIAGLFPASAASP